MSSALIYKMRLTAPNKPGTASHNSNYVKYIAEREHVMKLSPESESGLFGRIDGTNNDELDVTDTQNYVYGISKAGVTVYNAYISFRPEIAKRLELDSLEKWQNYIKFHIDTLMRGYDIPKDRFEYIAAVHDKKGQPHIHISFWDKDPPLTVQFVKKEVSDNVRKKLIHDTFANELSYYYGISNEAMSDAKELVGKLMIDFERDISGIYSNRFSGVDIPEELIQKYTDVLNNLPGRGRIAYAYLPKETKDMVIGMIKEMIMLPNTDAYKAAERMFYDNPDFVNATHTTMQALTKIALIDEWENELHNDLPSFIKSAFAWDELIGYGSIDDEIQYEETPVKVVRDFFLKEKGTMYSYEGEYTDCIWNLEERDGKPVINIAVKRENESKPVFSFDKTFEWNDITNAVIARIQQEKIYNKLVEHCYKFSKYHTDDYRVYDPEEGRTVIRGSAKQIKECFGKLLNKQEVKMLIETEIVPTLAKADEQFEVDCENDDMEI